MLATEGFFFYQTRNNNTHTIEKASVLQQLHFYVLALIQISLWLLCHGCFLYLFPFIFHYQISLPCIWIKYQCKPSYSRWELWRNLVSLFNREKLRKLRVKIKWTTVHVQCKPCMWFWCTIHYLTEIQLHKFPNAAALAVQPHRARCSQRRISLSTQLLLSDLGRRIRL